MEIATLHDRAAQFDSPETVIFAVVAVIGTYVLAKHAGARAYSRRSIGKGELTDRDQLFQLFSQMGLCGPPRKGGQTAGGQNLTPGAETNTAADP
jgi:hypothetical protein